MVELYERQHILEQPLALPRVVSVIGVGGVGSWVAVFSSMAGAQELRLFDGDSIELHNLNRIPLAEDCVGQQKGEAIRSWLSRLRPETAVQVFPHVSEANLSLLDGSGMVFICVDKMRVREMVEAYCKSQRPAVRFLHLAVEQDHFTISRTVEDVLSVDDRDGYDNPVAQWVCPQAMCAALGVYHLARCLNGEYIGDLRRAFDEGAD